MKSTEFGIQQLSAEVIVSTLAYELDKHFLNQAFFANQKVVSRT